MTSSTGLALDVDQLIPARPDTVFRCLTEPDLYARWFGPEGATVTVEEMQLALGGRLHLTIGFGEAGPRIGIQGFYEVIDPPVSLVHTWQVQGEELVTTVRFDLEPVGTHTRLRIRHRGFVDPVDLEQNRGGWSEHLVELATLARSIETPR